MLTTLSLYLTGLLLLAGRFFRGDRKRQSIICCFAMLYWPFINRTMLNGQLAAIGFLSIALAVCLEEADRRYLSGIALSVCVYKPTLLLLIVPMLFITRRRRTLIGFAAGTAILTTVTTLLDGVGVWPAYLRMSADFARVRAFVLCDYVALLAFS